MSVGPVCPQCDALTDFGVTDCPSCGTNLGWRSSGNLTAVRPPANDLETEAKRKMSSCPTCGSDVPTGDRFCGKCGSKMDESPKAPSLGGKTMYFSGAQQQGRAKLVLVKGDTSDGVSYQLNGTEHLVGRTEGAIVFGNDTLVSPRHANFFYREGKLFVRDEESTNGVFLRIRQPAQLDSGAVFLAGEQLLQVETVAPDYGPQPDSEGTYYYASPRRPSKVRLVQRLRGGDIGLIFRARGETITIGRENNDVNFPDDPFISGRHSTVAVEADGRFTLSDPGSKNGTFVRIDGETPLSHGDYVFIGQQLLRVEIT